MTSRCPMPSDRAPTISSAAATGVMGSSSPTATSVGASYAAELVDDVGSANELHPRGVELEILPRASPLLFIGDVWPERGRDASPLLVGHVLAAEAAPRDLRDSTARDAAEALDQPWYVEARKP